VAKRVGIGFSDRHPRLPEFARTPPSGSDRFGGDPFLGFSRARQSTFRDDGNRNFATMAAIAAAWGPRLLPPVGSGSFGNHYANRILMRTLDHFSGVRCNLPERSSIESNCSAMFKTRIDGMARTIRTGSAVLMRVGARSGFSPLLWDYEGEHNLTVKAHPAQTCAPTPAGNAVPGSLSSRRRAAGNRGRLQFLFLATYTLDKPTNVNLNRERRLDSHASSCFSEPPGA
jgi:hypothetical protein